MSFTKLNHPFIIAEIGGNHEGDFQYAKKLLDDASDTGVDAIKFQTYTADRIVNQLESPSRNKHFTKFELPIEQYIELAERCKARDTAFMTSLWDLESIVALDPFIDVHKVGSGDLTNYRLLKPLAETGKPLCIATAMATMDETLATVAFIRSVNSELVTSGKLCVMHCVAMYGNPLDEFANLNFLKRLRERLRPEIAIGYSDHTCGNVAVKVALEFGVSVIETHFTDDNGREFRDHHFAHNKTEMADFVKYSQRRRKMLEGCEAEIVHEVETADRITQFRRACYPIIDLNAGEKLELSNLTTLRPMSGIPATEYFNLIGRKLKRDIHSLSNIR